MRLSGVLVLVPLLAASAPVEEKIDAYLEWRQGDVLVAGGQRLVVGRGTQFKGQGLAFTPGSIPLGYEIRAKGERQKDGSIALRELDARPNGQAWLEADIKQVTDQAEAQYRKLGRFVEQGPDGRVENVGRLLEKGPQVDRVRRIVDALAPPHIEPADVRVYVIENEEWNAFAMGNYSIYVFSGLLDDMDDDEVAIVLGHELVHASHEHTRRDAKKQQVVGLGAIGALFLGEGIGNEVARGATQVATQLAASALASGYSRDYEDQADRVGLRYAYEGGFDVTKGPALWQRFAKKYGEGNRALNFFFSDHSLAAARARNLERELAQNYPSGPKSQGPRSDWRADAPRLRDGGTRAQLGAEPAVADIGSAPGQPAGETSRSSASTRIEVGMTPTQVRSRLGDATRELRYGDRVKWIYPELAVVFEAGRVSEVQF